MAQTTKRLTGKQALRPRARILRTLGDELISSEMVAVIELVKNAYDADATRVLIWFHEPLGPGQGRIEIIDDGHGMDLETICSVWMEPATLIKKRRPRSEQMRRRVLGEKGIGRFATSHLADYLEIVTRRAEMDREVRVFFDWSQFDDDEKFLDQVKVHWEEADLKEICPGGTIEELWEEDERPEIDYLNHGTILRMDRLRTIWSKEQFEMLHIGLSRLISPFFEQSGEFSIRLKLPSEFERFSGIVESPVALKTPHYMVKGDIDENGSYEMDFTLRGHKDQVRHESGTLVQHEVKPQCGPFTIQLWVWDRDPTSLGELAREHHTTLSDIRRDLDAVAGINIYRDGFRVLPYGEPHTDWLRLDMRRVQNPTLRLSNNQIVGYILISADVNPDLRDQSNREGIVEGQALEDLRTLVKGVLNLLELKRYDIRHRRPEERVRPGGLFAGLDLSNIVDVIRSRYPDDAELLDLMEKRDQELRAATTEAQNVIARYRRLATLGQLIDTVLHDGRTPLSKIGNEVELAQRDIEREDGIITGDLISRIIQRFRIIRTQSDVLSTVFRRLEPFGGRKRGRPVEMRLEQAVTDAFSVLESEIAEVGVQSDLPATDTWITADQAEIQEVIINLLQNSLYWLRNVPKEARQIIVHVDRRATDEVEILFSDSGPGVQSEYQEYIFDPYFSTKPNGVGLGLTIAGEIVSEYYGGALELLGSGPLSGANFRITLHRRV